MRLNEGKKRGDVMGCDIHAYIEYDDEGEWESFAHVTLSRWYELFGHLAGVRRPIEPVVAPRGVPNNIGFIARWDYADCGSDAHHASWLTLDELKTVANRCTNIEFDALIASMDSLFKAGFEPRLVFWFDN